MAKRVNETFKFDPTSFWHSSPNYEDADSIFGFDKNTGEVVLVPASELEIQSEEENVKQINNSNYNHNLLKNKLDPKQIKLTAQWLREKSNFLNVVARQLAFHFIELYEQLLKIDFKKTQSQFEREFPPNTIILDEEGGLVDVKINFDENRINQIVEHLKQELAPGLEDAKTWEQTAEELLTYLVRSAIERRDRDLGTLEIYNLSSDDRAATFYKYLNGKKAADLNSEIPRILLKISVHIASNIARNLDLSNLTTSELELILGFKQNNNEEPVPVTESRLTNAVLPIPSFAAFSSAIVAQLRKDLWRKDSKGIAYFKHQAKGNPTNYIEHYISNPGDIELLPLEQAEQIIDKFGFNTVKLHLIFAAHTMNQPTPWSGKFSLKASNIIKYLGWDKRTDLPVHQKLNEIAKAAFVLDCLLVKSVWVEGRNKKGGINASTPTGRMWNVVVDPRGQLDIERRVEKPKEVYITVQPGLIFHSFLNKAGSKLKEALYQFGYLAQDILRIDPYHDELALRLAIHLAMESRVHTSGKYRVETLLKHLLPHTVVDTARSNRHKGYELKQRWNNALKLLMNLEWQIQFDESYPSWLRPESEAKKPKDSRKMKIIEWLFNAKITIKPPEPIPELLASKAKPKQKAKKPKFVSMTKIRLTSDQIRKGRNAKGWSQRKLAGWLGVTQTLVGYWEKGKRTPSEEMEVKLRQLLEITD